jgi:hypothetical protein
MMELLVATSLLILGLMAFTLYKVKKIHLATYRLTEDARIVRNETLALFSQLQALLALERRLVLPKALPATRGWAGSPDFLLVVLETILSRRPTTVLECSSGVSTLVAARALQMNGKGHVYSLEHDAHHAAKTRKLLDEYGLHAWASVIDAPLVTTSFPSAWYSPDRLPADLDSIDMLVVDGPPSATGALARYPALPALADRLHGNTVVLADDTEREDERATLLRWKSEFPEFRQEDMHCEKGCVMLTNERVDTGANRQ